MGDENLDARKSQGLIAGEQAQVEQQFGDRQTAQIEGGGDYAGRNIDKRTFINIFLGSEVSSPISSQSMQTLVEILEQVTDGQTVKRTYQESLPPDSYVSRPEVSDVGDMVAQLQEFRRLKPFLRQLATNTDVPESIRKQIKSFGEQLGEPEMPSQPAALVDNSSCLQSYLQVVLRPDLSSSGLVVNTWLIPDETVLDPAKRYQPLDLDDSQKGASCQIQEVPIILNQFLNQALSYLAGRRYELTIEVFLPLEHLCTGVDAWELEDLFFEEDTYLVGTKYQVIVRSQERLDPRYLYSRLNQWHRNWDRVKACLSEVPQVDDFEHLTQLNCDWKQLGNRLKQKLGLKMTCGLVTTHQKDLFTCILKTALPIAIWPRTDLASVGQEAALDQLVTAGPLFKLLAAIRQKREDADCASCPTTHIGSHLAVLWEDPNRLTPDALAQLRPPGQ